MDWNAAIDKNREALKRILVMLVAMTGLSSGAEPGAGAGLGAGGQFTLFPQKDAAASRLVRAEKSKLSPALTLPRHLHRFVLKLLRPAEAAVRRLIIVAARGLVVTLPPVRQRKPKPKPIEPILRSLGIAVTMSSADFQRAEAARQAAALRAARPRKLSLPLLDPLKTPFRVYRRYVPAHAAPRILFPGIIEPFALPLPPSPDDPVNAARLALRLEALGRALDDLPGQAKRFARWKARCDAALMQDKQGRDATVAQDGKAGGASAQNRKAGKAIRFQRLSPLKPGRPPGWRRKPVHEVHEVLNDVHGLAFWTLESPDTS